MHPRTTLEYIDSLFPQTCDNGSKSQLFFLFFFSVCHLDSSGLYYNSDWLRSPPGGCRLTTGLNRNRADLDLTRLVPVVFALSPKVSFFVDFLHLLIQPITNNISTCIRLGWQTCLWSSTTGVRCYNHHLVCT